MKIRFTLKASALPDVKTRTGTVLGYSFGGVRVRMDDNTLMSVQQNQILVKSEPTKSAKWAA